MHKRIVKAIQQAITQDKEIRNKKITILIDKKKTAGFWGMTIIVGTDYLQLLPHIEAISEKIGHFYGEGLWFKRSYNAINIS